jgi:hypothetical protein
MEPLHIRFRQALPRLIADNYRETSPVSWDYNCIAWAAEITDTWWWPAPGRYWPTNIPREETLAAFLALFGSLGYAPGATRDIQPNLRKVAIYATGDSPTHAARQLADGWWTSKLGPHVDIEHQTPDAIRGGLYGEVVAVLSRIER